MMMWLAGKGTENKHCERDKLLVGAVNCDAIPHGPAGT
jgi:hypothetical protein